MSFSVHVLYIALKAQKVRWPLKKLPFVGTVNYGGGNSVYSCCLEVQRFSENSYISVAVCPKQGADKRYMKKITELCSS
jgi:hypothetical protein